MAKTTAVTSLALLLIFPAVIYGANILVGDDSSTGWNDYGTTNYAEWAKGQTFTTKDLLVFQFSGRHSVAEVTETGFNYCDGNDPISFNDTSPTAFPLTTAGPRYFICPTSGHCALGMKLAITVTDGSDTPPSGTTTPPPSRTTPSVQSPPSGTSTPPPSRTTPSDRSPTAGTTPSTPDSSTTPKPSDATVVLAGWNCLLIVVATLFGVIS